MDEDDEMDVMEVLVSGWLLEDVVDYFGDVDGWVSDDEDVL